jgi:transcriptional regulator with XRE-family HTH domain
MKTKNIIPSQAVRLKKIRLYLGMTRQQFGDAVDISQYTIRSWENGEKNFTADGIQRVISSLKEKINFSCPFDWLMYGSGTSPISLYEESAFRNTNEIQFDSTHENLLKEIVTFKQLNPLASIVFVSDNTFSPIAEVGDYIGLVLADNNNLDDYIGKIVYFSLKDDLSEFGILKKSRDLYRIIHFLDIPPSKLKIENISKLYQFVWLRKIY